MNTARSIRTRTWTAVLVAITGCESTVTVESDVAPVAADHTVSVLHSHHVGAWKAPAPTKTGGALFDVRILADDVPAAIRVLRERGATTETVADSEATTGSLPTPNEEHQRSLATIAVELERTLRLWTGIVDARVHINVPRGTDLREPAHAEGRAVVVLRLRDDDAPADSEVQALVANAVHALPPEHVTVIRGTAQASTPTPLVQIGPIAITHSSAKVLRVILVALLSLTASLTIALVWLWRRKRDPTG